MNVIEEYKNTIIRFGEYLCIARIKYIDDRDEDILCASPFVTSGEIKAYHHMMYMWQENSRWIVQEPGKRSRECEIFFEARS